MFDWSNLERSAMLERLNELAPKLVNQLLSVDEFHSIVSKYLKRHLPVKISKNWDSKVKSHITFIGGCYYSDKDEDDEKCIEISFYYNPAVSDFKMSMNRFRMMCRTIADTLLHEIIHMRQFRRRKFKALPNYPSTASSTKLRDEQSYLGSTDEIDAYGFNIACELVEKYRGNQRAIVKHLNKDFKHGRENGGCWKMYLKAFEHDHKHEIIKRLKKKVIRYLPRAIEGRPFKSCDWICY
jgi:hypothetical protein